MPSVTHTQTIVTALCVVGAAGMYLQPELSGPWLTLTQRFQFTQKRQRSLQSRGDPLTEHFVHGICCCVNLLGKALDASLTWGWVLKQWQVVMLVCSG